MERTKAGVTFKEREQIRKTLVELVQRLAGDLSYPEEAIVQEIRYWQQSVKDWATNPSASERKQSYLHHDGICWHCKEKINSLEETTFHHFKRGIRNLHGPENMVPLHKSEEKMCHEILHGASRSLTGGSFQSKKKTILKKKAS